MVTLRYAVIALALLVGQAHAKPGEKKPSSATTEQKFKWHSETRLGAYLSPETSHGVKFNKDTLYNTVSMVIAQKVDGGYLLTAPAINWGERVTTFGFAYIETDALFTADQLYSGWVYYVDELTFTGANGFPQNIPHFRPYTGKEPPTSLPPTMM